MEFPKTTNKGGQYFDIISAETQMPFVSNSCYLMSFTNSRKFCK